MGDKQPGPVGSFKPNAFGLYDMAGSLWQLVQDCYNDNYDGAPPDGSVWTTGDCNNRVTRGGSWDSPPEDLRSARRGGDSHFDRNWYAGFRIARTLTP
jgi:formylglycine-generating enzyme required for sulfatase activity